MRMIILNKIRRLVIKRQYLRAGALDFMPNMYIDEYKHWVLPNHHHHYPFTYAALKKLYEES